MKEGALMENIFDINKFDSYKEDNRREVKKANNGLPASLWESYSAFANCYGGVIILGVAEKTNGAWYTTGLRAKDKEKLLKAFWDTVNNHKKVNVNLLSDTDVNTYIVNDDIIIVIEVPMAKREQRPIYINDNLFGGTYRRNYEGDYRCTPLQVKTMLRDQTEISTDMQVLDDALIEDLNYETIHGYRNRHISYKPGHPFERLDDASYLRRIGAAAISKEDKRLHPTAAGMLMFGNEYDIIRYFPEYFLDYQEKLEPNIRWTDRLQSSSGEWSGNLCDFYFRVYNKITKVLKTPFAMEGGNRIDDTPVHKAVREAVANCIIHADYHGTGGIVIKSFADKLIFANPGYIRIGKHQMKLGGDSDPRNKVLMKMFNLINIGERSGSGVPSIFNAWEDNSWKEPIIEESFAPDRTVLCLEFVKKQAEKASGKNKRKEVSGKKQAEKTLLHKQHIRELLCNKGVANITDIALAIGLSTARARAIISVMDDVLKQGQGRSTVYVLTKDEQSPMP